MSDKNPKNPEELGPEELERLSGGEHELGPEALEKVSGGVNKIEALTLKQKVVEEASLTDLVSSDSSLPSRS